MQFIRHAILGLALILSCGTLHAGDKVAPQAHSGSANTARLPADKIEFGSLLTDIQKTHGDQEELYLLLWLPLEYWSSSFARAGESGESKSTREMLELLSEYTIFAAVKGNPSAFGRSTYADESELRRMIRITDTAGESYQPLEPEQIDKDMRTLLQMLRPIFAKMAGSVGENAHFILFPGKNRSGRTLVDATGSGWLRVRFDNINLDYRLPLGSLLAPKRDPATGETFPGNYDYNPFTGTQLEIAPSSK